MFQEGLFSRQEDSRHGRRLGARPRDGGEISRARAEIAICGRRKSVCDEAAAAMMAVHGTVVKTHGIDIRDAAAVSKQLNPGEEPGARTKARNPQGRVGSLEELQNLATFLMSDGWTGLSGETIVMDGAEALATGGNFYELRGWGDAE